MPRLFCPEHEDFGVLRARLPRDVFKVPIEDTGHGLIGFGHCGGEDHIDELLDGLVAAVALTEPHDLVDLVAFDEVSDGVSEEED